MRKHTILVLCVLFATSAFSLIPMQPDAEIVMWMGVISHPNNTSFFHSRGFAKYDTTHYMDRYGIWPREILWTDLPDAVYMMSIGFRVEPAKMPYQGFNRWMPPPTTEMLLPNFRLIFEEVKTGVTDTFRLAEIPLEHELVYPGAPMGYSYTVIYRFDAYDLPIPDDNTAWRVWPEIWETVGDPTTIMNLEADTFSFVRTPIRTVYDSLTSINSPRFADDDIHVWERLRSVFPSHPPVLNKVWSYYLETENCDSMESVGQRILAVVDTHSQLTEFEKAEWNEYIQARMDEVCGEE